MTKERWIFLSRILILILVVGLSIFLYLIRDQVQHLEGYGYPGIFLVSIIANATVIIPLPGVMVTSAMGAVFNPFWVAVAAGSGAAFGELSGYLAGYSGRGVIERVEFNERVNRWFSRLNIFKKIFKSKVEESTSPEVDWLARLENWLVRYGGWAILILAFIPNPLFDMAGLLAGALKMKVHKFLFWTWLGKILKMMLFAYGGASLLGGL